MVDLYTWFGKMNLTQYVPLFVKENIFRDVLHLVDEKVLNDMGITKAGDKMRILSGIDEIKARRGRFFNLKNPTWRIQLGKIITFLLCQI